MEEIWKDIVGYEGFYKVSSKGRVKSVERYRIGKRNSKVPCKAKIMSLQKSNGGYYQVLLCKNKHKKLVTVHRLVAFAFIPNDKNKPCVDHINGIRTDNRVENLRWCTIKENLNFDLARSNISKANKGSEKCRKHTKAMQVACRKSVVIVFPNGEVREYASVTETEKDGFNHSIVSACCRGKYKTSRRCKCYYKENYDRNKT